jgi:hypothetical protein
MGNDGRIERNIVGQRHGIGRTVPNQVSGLGSCRHRWQRRHGQGLLVIRFDAGIRIAQIDHQEFVTGLLHERSEFGRRSHAGFARGRGGGGHGTSQGSNVSAVALHTGDVFETVAATVVMVQKKPTPEVFGWVKLCFDRKRKVDPGYFQTGIACVRPMLA